MVTLNNWTPDELASWIVLVETQAECSYLVFQEEKGDNGHISPNHLCAYISHFLILGTPHLQGYLELTRTMRYRAIQRFPGFSRASIHQRRGSQAKAVKYCTKLRTRTIGGPAGEFGVLAVQGQRLDLVAIRDEIMAGATQYQIAVDHFPTWVRNYRAFERFAGLHANHLSMSTERCFPETIVLWGVSGIGKSHWVRERFPGAFWLTRGQGAVWFDLMNSQHTVLVLDDFYSWIPYDLLLRLCDKNPLQLPTKGGFLQCPNLTHIIITSNDDPHTWYHSFEKMRNNGRAFFRRVEDKGYIREFIMIGPVRPPVFTPGTLEWH